MPFHDAINIGKNVAIEMKTIFDKSSSPNQAVSSGIQAKMAIRRNVLSVGANRFSIGLNSPTTIPTDAPISPPIIKPKIAR